MTEPTSDEAMAAWIAAAMERRDPYIAVAREADAHRVAHGCDLYPSVPGQPLAVIAAAAGARRILEIGGGTGYSALWLASGNADARVDTIEADPAHVATLIQNVRRFGMEGRINVLAGRDQTVLPGLEGSFDMIFYDAGIPGPELVEQAERLVGPGGSLLASNVFLGRYVPDHPDLPRGTAFREAMLDRAGWRSGFVNGKLLAVRTG